VEVIDGGVASGRRVVAAEKRERAWELRKRGLTYRKIAEVVAAEFGSYSKSQAERDIKRVLDELQERTLDVAAEARAEDLARIDDLMAVWFATALREHERPGMGGAAAEGSTALDAVDWSALPPMELLEAVFKQAMLSKQATEIILKLLEQRAKLLGLHRQEVALTTPAPLVVADLSGMDEDSLNAIVRNLSAALGAGEG